MKPVFQSIYHPTKGDCHRSSIASLFDLELSQVPHFGLFSEERWPHILQGFVWGMGYNWTGNGILGKDLFKENQSINGFFEASVPNSSPIKTHSCHSVVIDMKGVVVHDPDKNQPWLNINVLKSGDLKWWTLLEKQTELKV